MRLKELVEGIKAHPGARGSKLRAVGRIAFWQAWKRAVGKPVTLPVFGGMRLRCYPDSDGVVGVWYYGLHDYHAMRFMQLYLRPGDGMLDVGANVGIFTILAASIVGRDAPMDAVEATPATAARLQENVDLNGLVHARVHAVAVSDAPGEVQFALRGEDVLNHIRRDGEPEDGCVVVPAARLDDLTRGRRYALGKMDVEGAELMAMRGALAMLTESNPPVWILEMNGIARRYGLTDDQLAEYLDERGYDLCVFDAESYVLDRRPAPWTRRREGNDNVLAIARGSWESVLDRLPGIRIVEG